MVRVAVKVLCPNCGTWYRVGFAELDTETLGQLKRLLERVRFKPVLDLPQVFERLSELVELEAVTPTD